MSQHQQRLLFTENATYYESIQNYDEYEDYGGEWKWDRNGSGHELRGKFNWKNLVLYILILSA